MTCKICGQKNASGAKLCDDCRAARKRAYDPTVTQPLLAMAGEATLDSFSSGKRRKSSSKSAESNARRAARKAADEKRAAVLPVHQSPRKASTPMVLFAFLSVLLIGVYALHWVLSAPKGEGEGYTPVERSLKADAETVAPTDSPSPRALGPARAVSSPAEVSSAATPGRALTLPVDGEGAEAATRGVPAKVTTAKRAAPIRAPVIVIETPPLIAEPIAPAPAPELRPPPRVDPWQQMADAVARCSREGFFARVICEQKVRLQYCEGHWGQVAQCPGGPASDR